MSETDATSAALTAEIFNDLYGTVDYEVVFSAPDPSDRTGFVYDSSTVSLLGSVELVAGLTHTILRGDFRPVGVVGAPDFHVYSIHLKSGDGPTERRLRMEEAEVIRIDAESLGPNAYVLYGGDFNWQSADEDAWDVFTSEGIGKGFDAFDVANVLGAGDWRDDDDFRRLHSQDPRARKNVEDTNSRMDDRFDLQFVTEPFIDGVGLELVQSSYRVFGNNGTHELNEPITTGEGASAEVLLALASFSDHLPVVSDFAILDLLVGDVDGDGAVAFADFLVVSANFGLRTFSAIKGDIDGDGEVAFPDFLLLAENFGSSVVKAATVPEPAARLMAIVMIALVALRKRHPLRILLPCITKEGVDSRSWTRLPGLSVLPRSSRDYSPGRGCRLSRETRQGFASLHDIPDENPARSVIFRPSPASKQSATIVLLRMLFCLCVKKP